MSTTEIAVGAATALGLGVIALGPAGGLERLTAGPKVQGLIAALASKWGGVFGVPPIMIIVIASIESNFRAGAHNSSNVAVGGAWGCMQVNLVTAQGIAKALAASTSPLVKATLAKWNGTGASLLTADVGVMFGTYYLAKLVKEFGNNLALVAAAYHGGPGLVRKMQAAKTPIPEGLPPKGKEYVARAQRAYGSYA
jgi:soluble lytic murein transglycosylase